MHQAKKKVKHKSDAHQEGTFWCTYSILYSHSHKFGHRSLNHPWHVCVSISSAIATTIWVVAVSWRLGKCSWYNLRIQTKTGKSAAFSGAQTFKKRQSSLADVLAVQAGSGELYYRSIATLILWWRHVSDWREMIRRLRACRPMSTRIQECTIKLRPRRHRNLPSQISNWSLRITYSCNELA